jgi:protoporphyrinogen/coproporphyrinogen III oxidase
MSLYDAIIIGGGIAGMTAALPLKRKGYNVLVLEKDALPGGNIKTISQNGFRMETGPHSFMGSSEFTWKLVEELAMEESIEPAATTSKNRYIYRHEKLKPLPMSASSFIFTTLLSPISKLRLMMEPFMPNGARDEDTAWDFFVRRFGKEAATYIMTPFISGVYAGDVKMLGARAAFNKFWKFEKDSGSMIMGAFKYMKAKRKRLKAAGIKMKRGLFSFDGGLGTITTKLADELSDCIETGIDVTEVGRNNGSYVVTGNGKHWQAKSLIIATPPPTTGQLVSDMLPDLSPVFYKIPMSPVALLHWRVRDKDGDYPDGFGFLMPREYDLRVLGTLFPSKLFKGRMSDGWQLFATFYGGMTDPDAMKLDDGALTELLLDEHRRIFNRELEDAEVLKIIRYPGAIPQLLPNHPETIDGIQSELTTKAPGLFLAGNYLTGVGIEHAVESGYRASDQGLSYLFSLAQEKAE